MNLFATLTDAKRFFNSLISPSLGAFLFSPRKHSLKRPRVRVKKSGLDSNLFLMSSGREPMLSWKRKQGMMIVAPKS